MKNFLKKKRNLKFLLTLFLIFITIIIALLILIYPLNKHNSSKNPYLFYLDYKEKLDKYNNNYEIYQLNTSNIFKYDKTRYDNEIFKKSLESIKNIQNITNPNEINTSNDKLKIIISNKEGLSSNDNYNKTLEILKNNSNIKLYIIGALDTSYTKNTSLPLNPLHDEAVYVINNIEGEYSITDIDTNTKNFLLEKRPQLFLYVYYSIWNIEKNYFINK